MVYSMHGRDVLEGAEVVDDMAALFKRFDMVVGTTGKHGKRPSMVRRFITPEELARRLAGYSGSVLLVFGREDIGLTNEELAMCDAVVTIPANPEYPILNLSHAVAVILYELYKHLGRAPKRERRLPTREEVDLLIHYTRVLSTKLGIPEHKVVKVELMLRRVIAHCDVSSGDVRALLGIMRRAAEAVLDGGVQEAPGR